MAAILIQDSVGSVVLFIETTAGAAATGLVDTDVTADLKKAGGSFAALTLSPTNWDDLGDGFYEVSLEDTDTDVLGNLYLRVQGAGIRTALEVAYVADTAPVNPSTVTPPSTVAIFGYLYNTDAQPAQGASVSAQVLGSPTVLHPGTDGLALTQGAIYALTDSDGFFSIELISGVSVDISIPAARYRRTFLVPGSSTNLFDIP